MAIFHNRAELLMLEIQEERERARLMVFLAAGVGIFGMMAALTITALIACAAAAHLLTALIILAAVYLCGAVFFFIKFAQASKNWEMFRDTRDQLQKDREWLENKVT